MGIRSSNNTIMPDCSNALEENEDERVTSDIMAIAKTVVDMESDEDTFSLRVTDDSGVEDNLNESSNTKNYSDLMNADSRNVIDSLDKKEKVSNIRILSDNYYDDDSDEDSYETTNTIKLDQSSRQAELTDDWIQSNCIESFSEHVVENIEQSAQSNCVASLSDNTNENSEFEFSLTDFIEELNAHIEANNTEAEDSGVLDSMESSNKHIEIDLPNDKEGIYLTENQRFGEIDVNLENQQALEDFDLIMNQVKSQSSAQVKIVNRELEEGEIDDNELEVQFESIRKEKEKSVELVEVPDEVNDRLFDSLSDVDSDITLDNNSYDDCEYIRRNLSPLDDGDFSTIEEDPWDYIQSSLSDDCVIVDEIECPPRFVRSYTLPHEKLITSTDQGNEEYPEKNDNRRKISRKRKSSTSSSHDCEEERKKVDNNEAGLNYNDLTGICSKEEVSQLPDDIEHVSKKNKPHSGRDEDHPLFRDIDVQFCEKLMRVKKQGEIIIRPSSKGFDYLKITWKVTDDIYQHLKVKKKLKSSSSSKFQYWINSREFRNLDEILTKYVKPMALNALKLIDYKHFKKGINGVKAIAEELLTAEKKKNPSCIPYNISAVKKSPGKFLISYLPRDTCYHEYIKVAPEGFRFRDQSFDNLNDLLIYFKANSKEVKNTTSKDDTVTSTTHSRPVTPRPPTPKIHGLTPSILEVIQDFPDEKLESMRLILDNLAQSNNNPTATLNQNNPAPVPFIFNGYCPSYPSVAYPTVPYSAFRPYLPSNNNMPFSPMPVPYPQNLDLPVPDCSQSRIEDLPLPPGTS